MIENIEYRRVTAKHGPAMEIIAEGLCNVGLRAMRELDKRSGLEIGELALRKKFGGVGISRPTALDEFLGVMEGRGVRNGVSHQPRKSALYVARTNGEDIGWLTTAVDYTETPRLRRLAKSYLWLVNAAVDPDYQGQGVMRGLLDKSLSDTDMPRIASVIHRVVAYPYVSRSGDGTEPPAVVGLRRLGFSPIGAPKDSTNEFGIQHPVSLQRHVGGSPSQVLARLRSIPHHAG